MKKNPAVRSNKTGISISRAQLRSRISLRDLADDDLLTITGGANIDKGLHNKPAPTDLCLLPPTLIC
jgi:hypothetical protein